MSNTAMKLIDNTTSDEMVIVPDLKPNTEKAGAMIHWRLTGSVSQELLLNKLSEILPDNMMPTESGSEKYLRRAFDAIVINRNSDLVRKVKNKGGFSLVREDNSQIDLEKLTDAEKEAYSVDLTARVVSENGQEVLKITPESHPQAQALRNQFELEKTLFSASVDISQWLSVKVMGLVNAVNYRDRGGVYVIPPGEDLARFNEIKEALHSVSQFDSNGRLLSGCKIYTIPVVSSENLQEAVIDSLTEDLDALVTDIVAKVNENKLTLRGWAGQRKLILAMHAKFKKFEEFMGCSLEFITEKLSDLEINIGVMEASLYQEKIEEEAKKNGKG